MAEFPKQKVRNIVLYGSPCIRTVLQDEYVQGSTGGLRQTFVDFNITVPLPSRVWWHGKESFDLNYNSYIGPRMKKEKSTKVCCRPPASPCSVVFFLISSFGSSGLLYQLKGLCVDYVLLNKKLKHNRLRSLIVCIHTNYLVDLYSCQY